MRTRVYRHNGKAENPNDYVEFDLASYKSGDIERVKEEHFTACGKNCYLTVEMRPESEKEDRMVSFFPWQGEYKKYTYTHQARYAVIGNEIQQRISDACFNDLDGFLSEDKKTYNRWMSSN